MYFPVEVWQGLLSHTGIVEKLRFRLVSPVWMQLRLFTELARVFKSRLAQYCECDECVIQYNLFVLFLEQGPDKWLGDQVSHLPWETVTMEEWYYFVMQKCLSHGVPYVLSWYEQYLPKDFNFKWNCEYDFGREKYERLWPYCLKAEYTTLDWVYKHQPGIQRHSTFMLYDSVGRGRSTHFLTWYTQHYPLTEQRRNELIRTAVAFGSFQAIQQLLPPEEASEQFIRAAQFNRASFFYLYKNYNCTPQQLSPALLSIACYTKDLPMAAWLLRTCGPTFFTKVVSLAFHHAVYKESEVLVQLLLRYFGNQIRSRAKWMFHFFLGKKCLTKAQLALFLKYLPLDRTCTRPFFIAEKRSNGSAMCILLYYLDLKRLSYRSKLRMFQHLVQRENEYLVYDAARLLKIRHVNSELCSRRLRWNIGALNIFAQCNQEDYEEELLQQLG